MKKNMEILQKLGIELLYHSIIPLLGIDPEKIITERDLCTPLLTVALCPTARTWKQPRWPLTDEQIRKL